MRNKTILCMLAIVLLTNFFFARSVAIKRPWIMPVPTSDIGVDRTDGYVSVHGLIFANNWLHSSPSKLFFGLYLYPASVEMSTLEQRGFYASFPPGYVLPMYLLFKSLDVTGLVPNIYEKRDTQLAAASIFNCITHLLLVFILCMILMVVCLKIGFDALNSTLLAIVPAIVQFHDLDIIRWNYFNHSPSSVIMLPFVVYVFLELLRIVSNSPRVLKIVKIMQPLTIFYGFITDWLFVFLILTVYLMRMIRKEVALPDSLQKSWLWLKQSFLFFSPALIAVMLWLWQIIHYKKQVMLDTSALSIKISSQGDYSTWENFLFRTGVTGSASDIINWLQATLVGRMHHAYGMIGMLILYLVSYLALRARKFKNSTVLGKPTNLVTTTYLMLFAPCLAHVLFFLNFSSSHPEEYLKFSLALSTSFAFAPIFILQIMRRSYSKIDMQTKAKRNITLVALFSFFLAISYIYSSKSVSRYFFDTSSYIEYLIGNFIRRHTDYYDVVFSSSYYSHPTRSGSFFPTFYSTKFIHYAHNLDHVYHKTKDIEEEFNIKIFFAPYQERELARLFIFVDYHHLNRGVFHEARVGKILAFDGRQFHTWYEHVHECDVYPHRCH